MVTVVIYISIFSVLIPLSLAIAQWKKIPSNIAALRWLLIAGLISDVTGRILSSQSKENMWVGDIIMFIQFTVLLYIFSRQFERRDIFKIIYLVVVMFYAIILLFVEGASTFIRSSAVDGLILIVVSVIFFYKLLNELKVVNILRLPVLWISFATLFYYSGNFFVFLSRSYLQNDLEIFTAFWMLHNALNVTKNILFAVALWQSYRITRSTLHG